MIKLTCKSCKKVFLGYLSNNSIHCSRKCYGVTLSKDKLGHSVSEETRRKISLANTGRKHTEESRKNMSKSVRLFYKRGGKTWNDGLSGYKVKPMSEEGRRNISRALLGKKKSLTACKNMSRAKKGKPWTEEMRRAIPPSLLKGAEHPNWKGDKVGYVNLHSYLKSHFPKKGICDKCKKETYTERALKIGHEYTRDISDYDELCRSCHRSRDVIGTNNKKKFESKLEMEWNSTK